MVELSRSILHSEFRNITFFQVTFSRFVIWIFLFIVIWSFGELQNSIMLLRSRVVVSACLDWNLSVEKDLVHRVLSILRVVLDHQFGRVSYEVRCNSSLRFQVLA